VKIDKFSIFALFLLLAPCAFSQAQSNEPMVAFYGGGGTTLLHQCQAAIKLSENQNRTYNGQEAADGTYCRGYVNGIVDSMVGVSVQMQTSYCIPRSGDNQEQFVRIVLKYLQDHPESLNLPAVIPAANAIIGAFPCGK
jgi:hypothetical protein